MAAKGAAIPACMYVLARSTNLSLISMLGKSSGGPPLMFDHQMAIDCEAQILYVFGGRVLDGDHYS